MKVALCLHGLFNSTSDLSSNGIDGYEYIKRNIIDRHDVEVYIHCWNIELEDNIRKLYSPKLAIFEPQKDFRHFPINEIRKLKSCPRDPLNVISHFYSIQKCFNLIIGDYNCIIKSRFDLGRINRNSSGPGKANPFPVQCINLLDQIENEKLYMANWNHFHMGPADMWFYGDASIMRNFSRIYSDLENDFYLGSNFHKFAIRIENNPGDISNSIAYYKYWMISNGLWNKKSPLNTEWE